MSYIKAKRQKLTKQIRTQHRQQSFANQRQWREHHSLLTLIPFLVDQQNTKQFEQFLQSIASEDLSILNEGLSQYIEQKYEKLMTRKYYCELNLKYDNHQFDKDTFLVINLLRLKMRLNLSSKNEIELIKRIIKHDSQLCSRELFTKQKYSSYYMCHYKNMIKLIIELSLFVESFFQNQNQRQKLQYDLGVFILHQISVFPFMQTKLELNIQNHQYLPQIKSQFEKFQVYFLDILYKDSVNIFETYFHDKITTTKKIQFLQKMYEISVVIYDSFSKHKQFQIIRCFKILGKIINQITTQKQNIQNNQTLSIQYKNQISQILTQSISFFNQMLTQSPFYKISYKKQGIHWTFSKQIVNILFQIQKKDQLELQKLPNSKYSQYSCLAYYILQIFHEVQYRMLIQALKFLASAFSYSDKLIQKMLQIKIKYNGITFQCIITKLMNHISNEVRLNTFWLISNISGSQISYDLSLPFLKIIFQQQFLYWETNYSLKEQLFIIVLNYLCNIKQIQELQNLMQFEEVVKQNQSNFSNQEESPKKIKSKNMLEWVFQLLGQVLSIIKDKMSDESFIQRVLFTLYNLLNLQKSNNCFIKVKMQNWQVNVLLNDIYNDLPKCNAQTLEMIQKILEMIDQHKQS